MHTVDDFEALQVDERDRDYRSTAKQVHIAAEWGAYFDAVGSHVGLRLRFESTKFIETINAGTLERRNNAEFGAEMLTWF